MTNLAIDPFNNYRGNRRSNAVRERETAAIFTSSLQKTINLKSGQSSNFSRLLLPFEWWSSLNLLRQKSSFSMSISRFYSLH